MATTGTHRRLVNPMLGTYFGIFTSSLVGLVLFLLLRGYNRLRSRGGAEPAPEEPAVPAAPVMGYQDLQALQRALLARRSGLADYEGFYPRRYPVTGSMTLATGFPWNLR